MDKRANLQQAMVEYGELAGACWLNMSALELLKHEAALQKASDRVDRLSDAIRAEQGVCQAMQAIKGNNGCLKGPNELGL